MYSLDFRKLAVSVFKRFKNYRPTCLFIFIDQFVNSSQMGNKRYPGKENNLFQKQEID